MEAVILYNGGAQAVRFVPIDGDANPVVVASVEYRIDDLRIADGGTDREIVPDTPATQDPVSTTLTADSGAGTPNREVIPVVDATGFIAGRYYLLIAADQRTIVQCKEVDLIGNNVVVQNKLIESFPLGSTLRGLEIEATFPASEADKADNIASGGGPYGVTWAFDGRRVRQIVYVRRHNTPISVTREDLTHFAPGLSNHWGTMIEPELAIRAATICFVNDLTAARIEPSTYDSPLGREAIVHRACAQCYEGISGTDDNNLTIADRHQARYAQLVNNIKEGLDGVRVSETNANDQVKIPQRRRRIRFV